ncbi:MAG: DNA photolyase [Candidatus Desulfofervidaceae bacterium]|nr:DNA photolyase [Candidatus Desulfofervidaceae bacterium]
MKTGLKLYFPQKVLIDRTVLESDYTQEILARLKNIPQEVVDSKHIQGSVYDYHILYLTQNKGRFFRPCPCTNKNFYLSCEYRILEVGTNCIFNCTYCILQSYLNQPFIQVYTNLDKLFAELDSLTDFYRIGTGELTDSLFLDHITHLSTYLVPYFGKRKNLILELKTKSTVIDNLKGLAHNRHTVVSWSLNAPEITAQEESEAPGLKERLVAARKCQDWGYLLGFHFDPIIYFPGWETEYQKTIALLFQHIRPENIAWISLGTFRFMPSLKSVIQRRFPQSKIIYGEFIPALDAKRRYFKPLRIHIYKKMLKWIKEYAPDVLVYLCMERPEVWQKVFGFVPEDIQLKEMLDQRVKELSDGEKTPNRRNLKTN